MPFDQYMAQCVTHYYSTRDPFGAKGDFTTAPEISQLFGELVAAWVIDTWSKMGAPSTLYLVECGAGRGTLMADILRIAQKVPQFYDAISVHIVEISPVLKTKQQKALSQHNVIWHNSLDGIDHEAPMILIGNEFLDALPVSRLVYDAGQWHERCVALDSNDQLTWNYQACSADILALIPPSLLPYRNKDKMTVSKAIAGFIADLSTRLMTQGGVALFIDYGSMAGMMGDTVQALKNHTPCDIFHQPGECDITAHVDFSALYQQGLSADITVFGAVTQAHFLSSLGIEQRAQLLQQRASPQQQADIQSGLNRLTAHDQMGDLFKVIALASDATLNLEGFS